MKVVIVGAGIGGLTLAHALTHRGVDVVVLDRDAHVTRTGGYRLHLNAAACGSLRTLLPDSMFGALRALSAPAESFERMHVTDRGLRVVASTLDVDGGDHLMIGRVALRAVLAHGLGDHLQMATTVVGYESTRTGVAAVTEDGGRVSGDLLVAADGARSVIARQAAGHHLSAPVGLRGLGGRVALDSQSAVMSSAPPFLRNGPALAIGPHGAGLFLTLHSPARDRVRPPGWAAPLVEPASLIWGVIATERAAGLGGSGARSLSDVDRLLDGWSPWVRGVLAVTDPNTLGRYTFHAAAPSDRMVPWTDDRVTALGDAVHAMPPTGGRSASTAIVDAADLADVLTRGCTAESLPGYHDRLSRRGADAVRESLVPARWIMRSDNAVGSVVLAAGLPAAAGMRSVLTRRSRR